MPPLETPNRLEKSGKFLDYPAAASFAVLLDWHLNSGTRPNGTPVQLGKRWENKDFAAALKAVGAKLAQRPKSPR